MPELPEVEIMTRNVRQWSAGRRLLRGEVVDAALKVDLSALQGAVFGSAHRRGKYLCLPVAASMLVVHFRMTGKAILESTAARPHTRLRLHLDDGTVIAIVDTRRLGRVWMVPSQELSSFFASLPLGPEPWPQPRDGGWWRSQLAGLRGPIKNALMRQDRVAGLGNIAASEICFRARLNPHTPVPKLDASDWDAVATAVPAFVDHVLSVESGPEIAYVNEQRTAPNPFAVYARQGQPCPRCAHGMVTRTVQAGRASFFCAQCQPPR